MARRGSEKNTKVLLIRNHGRRTRRLCFFQIYIDFFITEYCESLPSANDPPSSPSDGDDDYQPDADSENAEYLPYLKCTPEEVLKWLDYCPEIVERTCRQVLVTYFCFDVVFFCLFVGCELDAREVFSRWRPTQLTPEQLSFLELVTL